ncbi:dUTP diphosphatase [Planococcus sp. ISL-109]|uniref:dUTP diphosphatase n=1 Tax=Planococcus sp. ISL-109 TaxID=2819166 RepID=UPI001BE7D632|nr:dUTP diphosphatase [Planococcus sp. ISL-109]MBT2582480.1 dUTP diphosphatase [Planococcus sp. ISL-109]
MNLQELFYMQRELDKYIQSNRNVEEPVFRKKVLALQVELSELANETRCFKFWSTKGPSDKETLLEEYVDCIHFMLSLGIEKGFDSLDVWPSPLAEQDLTELFLAAHTSVGQFVEQATIEEYRSLWRTFGAIATALGFSYDEVLQAYVEKNETNYKRQQEGY